MRIWTKSQFLTCSTRIFQPFAPHNFKQFSQLPFDLLEDKFVGTNNFLIQWIMSVFFSKVSHTSYCFSKGSIVAEFKLIYHTNDEPKEAFEMLKQEINDGNLGTLRVDPSSLVRIPSTTTGDFKLPFLLFISVYVVISLVISFILRS